MARPARDQSICRHCKLSEPIVTMRRAHGKPQGICTQCHNLRARNKVFKSSATNGLYGSSDVLTKHNSDCLHVLGAPAAYPLLYINSREHVGYIVLKRDAYFVHVWHRGTLYAINRYGMALFLANQGLAIQEAPIALQTATGEPVDLDTVGAGLEPQDPCDSLVMFDVKLREHAVKKVKREIDELKQHVKRRAKTVHMGPKAKPVRKTPS